MNLVNLLIGFSVLILKFRDLKISCYTKAKDDIIKYVSIKYKELRKGFERARRLSLRKGKKIRGLRKIERKTVTLDKRMQKYGRY